MGDESLAVVRYMTKSRSQPLMCLGFFMCETRLRVIPPGDVVRASPAFLIFGYQRPHPTVRCRDQGYSFCPAGAHSSENRQLQNNEMGREQSKLRCHGAAEGGGQESGGCPRPAHRACPCPSLSSSSHQSCLHCLAWELSPEPICPASGNEEELGTPVVSESLSATGRATPHVGILPVPQNSPRD